MKRPRKYFAVLVAGVLVAFVLTTLLLAGTGPGQRALLRAGAWAASSDDMAIQVGALEGSLFSSARISSLSLSDAEGKWAELGDIRFEWSPWSLIGAAVDIEKISIGTIALTRLPAAGAASDGAAETPGTGGPLIPPIRLSTLKLDEVVLGEAVLGQAARLSVSGEIHAADPASAISGTIAVKDLDRQGFAEARVAYNAGDCGIARRRGGAGRSRRRLEPLARSWKTAADCG